MKTLSLILISFSIILLSACSSKEVYKPVKVVDNWKNSGNSDVLINAVSQDAALVEQRKVLAGGKVLDITIAEDEKLLGFSDGWVLSSNIDGNITLQSTQGKKSREIEPQKNSCYRKPQR